MGGAIGALFGGPVGTAVGDVGDFVADKYAGQAFKAALDTGIGLSKFSKQLGPYAAILSNAAIRGPAAVAATHFILQQSDPEFRKRVNDINGTGK